MGIKILELDLTTDVSGCLDYSRIEDEIPYYVCQTNNVGNNMVQWYDFNKDDYTDGRKPDIGNANLRCKFYDKLIYNIECKN